MAWFRNGRKYWKHNGKIYSCRLKRKSYSSGGGLFSSIKNSLTSSKSKYNYSNKTNKTTKKYKNVYEKEYLAYLSDTKTIFIEGISHTKQEILDYDKNTKFRYYGKDKDGYKFHIFDQEQWEKDLEYLRNEYKYKNF